MMDSPSILFVGNFLSRHGINRTITEDLATQFAEAGYKVLTTSTRQARLMRLLDMLWTVFVHQREYHVAYVEVFSGLAFLWAEIVGGALRLLHKPMVLALHGGNLPVFARAHSHRVKRLLRFANVVTAPSSYLQEALREYREDILLIPNPLDVKDYPFRLRRQLQPRLVWLRAFHAIYNPIMVIKTINALCVSLSEIHLTMIGPDKGDGSLKETRRWIKQTSLENFVTIISGIPKSQVPSHLSQADIFINTANIDNTPISVMEAMACGLCVVSTNVGGISHLVEDGKDAILVPAGDWQGMSEAIQRLLTEPDLAKKISANAHQKAEQFDWSAVLPRWKNLFRELANRGTS